MYKELSISSEVPIAKLRKAVKDGKLNLTKKELSGSGATLHVHPESYSKALKAKKGNKGVRLFITKSEVEYPMTSLNGSGMHGASIWSKIWSGIKSAWNPVIKPMLSVGVDQLANAASAAVASRGQNPMLVGLLRNELKKRTGVGFNQSPKGRMVKGSQAAKDRMAKLRAMRKSGVSKQGASFGLD